MPRKTKFSNKKRGSKTSKKGKTGKNNSPSSMEKDATGLLDLGDLFAALNEDLARDDLREERGRRMKEGRARNAERRQKEAKAQDEKKKGAITKIANEGAKGIRVTRSIRKAVDKEERLHGKEAMGPDKSPSPKRTSPKRNTQKRKRSRSGSEERSSKRAHNTPDSLDALMAKMEGLQMGGRCGKNCKCGKNCRCGKNCKCCK